MFRLLFFCKHTHTLLSYNRNVLEDEIEQELQEELLRLQELIKEQEEQERIEKEREEKRKQKKREQAEM